MVRGGSGQLKLTSSHRAPGGGGFNEAADDVTSIEDSRAAEILTDRVSD